ncbi:MAG: hypothetical protein EOO38_24175, partial [Cytophagaceae bacterium]
ANQDEARITLSLQKIPLAEALRYVTGLANLKYEVTAQGVNVATHFPKSQSLVTKEWVLGPGLGSKLGDDVKAFLVSEGINFRICNKSHAHSFSEKRLRNSSCSRAP